DRPCPGDDEGVRAARGRGAGSPAAGRRQRAAAGGDAARRGLNGAPFLPGRGTRVAGSRDWTSAPRRAECRHTSEATMDHREFEAVVDEFGASAKDLVDLVEQARYEQPTAIEISRLLDAREGPPALIARLPALRAVAPPVDMPVALA